MVACLLCWPCVMATLLTTGRLNLLAGAPWLGVAPIHVHALLRMVL